MGSVTMQVVNPQLISAKKILLRYDIDVALAEGKVVEEFKLKAGIPTLNLCLKHAQSVVMMGHLGRPDGKVVSELSVEPIRRWLENQGCEGDLGSKKLTLLENLRFDPREEAADMDYARELAQMGDFYVNEAFSAHRPAVSTTILPTLLPHAAGLRFAEEVNKLTEVRNNPQKPFVAIMGGVKVADKLSVIQVLAKNADAVLVGGKLVHEIRQQNLKLPANVLVGKLTEDGLDIASETTASWRDLIMKAKMIVWNGPLGKFEDPNNDQTKKVGEIVVESGAQTLVGGGDIIAALNQAGLLDKISFVSVGGGAMLKLLSDGTLPTIEALQ